MKQSLDHLPEGKRRELEFVVGMIHEGFTKARIGLSRGSGSGSCSRSSCPPPCGRDRLAMIANIIDRRERPYRWRRVNAVIEATAHDNGCADADRMPPCADDVTYEQREEISLPEAVAWAAVEPTAVTLYLYDVGCGTP